MKKLLITLLLSTSACCMQAQTISDRDRKFAEEAAMGGLLEVKLGELAQRNSFSPEVKNLGQHMVNDHSKANNELKSLASKKGVILPTTLDEKAQKTYDRLAAKSGKAFDKAYSKCMVKDHNKDIAHFEKESKKGDDSEFRSWAGEKVATLKHHKEMAVDACKALKKK
jgi:putative membrane protein